MEYSHSDKKYPNILINIIAVFTVAVVVILSGCYAVDESAPDNPEIGINHKPIVTDQSESTDEDMPVSITLNVEDDHDPVEALIYEAVALPGHGELSDDTSQTFAYTPENNFHGNDTIVFRVTDTSGATSDPLTVSITVNPVNDAPVIEADEEITTEMDVDVVPVSYSLQLSASDVDEDFMSWSISSAATIGQADVDGTGSVSYIPAANAFGVDSFIVEVSDGTLSDTVIFNFTLNQINGSVFTPEQRNIADQIISVFENNTPVIQYSYAENLGDGRGITAGRAGFTSATSDMLEVIERYTEISPANSLAAYLPRLRELDETNSGSTQGLEGLVEIWAETATNDEVFRNVQDDVVDDYYYTPATVRAETPGVSLPLTLLNLYDAAIQHGDGDDPDGLLAMINRTSNNVGGTPADGISEEAWLVEFMSIRRSVLLNPHNHETQQVWAESVGRVDTLVDLYENNKFYLTPPIEINTWGTAFSIQ